MRTECGCTRRVYRGEMKPKKPVAIEGMLDVCCMAYQAIIFDIGNEEDNTNNEAAKDQAHNHPGQFFFLGTTVFPLVNEVIDFLEIASDNKIDDCKDDEYDTYQKNQGDNTNDKKQDTKDKADDTPYII